LCQKVILEIKKKSKRNQNKLLFHSRIAANKKAIVFSIEMKIEETFIKWSKWKILTDNDFIGKQASQTLTIAHSLI
jgi:hypothetical protein